VVVEFGDFFSGEGGLDRARTRTYLKSLDEMEYDAVSIASESFSHGLDFLEESIENISTPFVSLNAVDAESGEPVGSLFIVKTTDHFRIAITALTDSLNGEPDHAETDSPGHSNNSARPIKEASSIGAKIIDPVAALEKHMPSMAAQADIIILLSDLSSKRNAEIAKRFPRISVILAANPDGADAISDSTLIAGVRSGEGKKLGKLLLWHGKRGRVRKHKVEWHSIRKATAENRTIRKFLEEFYEEVATNEEFWGEVEPLFASFEHEKAEDSRYLGATKCATCHRKIYDSWSKTHHAGAYATLVTANRYFYPDCVNCHVTGAGYPTGFRIDQTTKHLEGVQCEMCHGPGGKHVDEQGASDLRMADDREFCAECHDAEFSPTFNNRFDAILPWVNHSDVPADLRTSLKEDYIAKPGRHPNLERLRREDPRLFAWLFEELASGCPNNHFLFECKDKAAVQKRVYLDDALVLSRDFDALMEKMYAKYGEGILSGEKEKARYRLKRQDVLDALQEAVDETGRASAELFIISHGSRAILAENLLFELRREVFGDKLEIALRFVAKEKKNGETGDGRFDSVNGQEEVAENIRQLLIQKHYPDKLWAYLVARNKSISLTDWRECARAAGIDPEEIEKRSASSEGTELLAEDIRFARSKGVTLAPTLLINGEKFVGRLQGLK
jgi:hypothetical protein